VLKKRHAGAAAPKLSASRHRARVTRASLYLRPSVVAAGGRIRVIGVAGRCARGDTVFVLSRVFAGRSFVGVGAITAPVRARGVFSAVGHLRRTAKRGRYTVSARCDGRNLATTGLRVT
jgi:hypothetical protein